MLHFSPCRVVASRLWFIFRYFPVSCFSGRLCSFKNCYKFQGGYKYLHFKSSLWSYIEAKPCSLMKANIFLLEILLDLALSCTGKLCIKSHPQENYKDIEGWYIFSLCIYVDNKIIRWLLENLDTEKSFQVQLVSFYN